MSLLQQITSTRPAGGPIPPVRMNIQGTDGIGKSTFGAGSLDPVFIQAEDGLSFIDVPRFPPGEHLGRVARADQDSGA